MRGLKCLTLLVFLWMSAKEGGSLVETPTEKRGRRRQRGRGVQQRRAVSEESEDSMARHSQAEQTTQHNTTHRDSQQCEANQLSESPSQSSVQEQTGHSHRRKRAHTSTQFEERMLTALEAVSRRASTPQEDSGSLFFKSLLEDFRTLSLRTRQDLKFQMHKLVYEAKCLEAGHTEHWGESNGGQLTSL
ncbi:hypothetical protein G5714_002761 [Onychostoma macrolepis]|uniref:BESS domain-containing protein n=1 Tax=Onychostoma macrolepis TaxID=369639 RepID=A0A7J6D7Z9_9TELE|nr:hypothetical protein G5714_002761 [Onychostoma macrolepis]